MMNKYRDPRQIAREVLKHLEDGLYHDSKDAMREDVEALALAVLASTKKKRRRKE